MLSNVVYKYSCEQCSATYYGETSRHLRTRIAEHRGLSSRTGLPSANPLQRSIRDHCLETNHDLNSDNFSILYKSKSINDDIKIAESILIKRDEPCLNTNESLKLNIM